MCGFILVASRGAPLKAIDSNFLSHRGPDHTEEVDFGWAKLRHWRLSIQDLTSASNQPICNADYCLAYNGELYDYKKIGEELYDTQFESDTKLVFHSLVINDFESLKYESGFYSFIFLNKIKKTFFSKRDYFGKKPLYFFYDDNLLVLASEESAIREICAQYQKYLPVCSESIVHYFVYKDLHYGATFFKGIKEVPPGASVYFDFEKWKFEVKKSWDDYYSEKPFYKVAIETSNGNKQKNLKSHISESIIKRFIADVPIQLALSGGVDSTLVAIFAKKQSLDIHRALTVSSDSRPTEAEKSKQLCKKLDLKHLNIDFNQIDVLDQLRSAIKAQGAPLSHPHALAVNILAAETRNKGKVLVTGEGADELFYGYTHYKSGHDSTFAFAEHLNIEDFFELDSGDKKMLKPISSKIYSLNRYLEKNDGRDLDVKTHLLSLLRRNDRISMHNSVEMRSAFLDYYLFRTTSDLHISGELKKGKSTLIDLIKESFGEYEVDPVKIGFYVPFDDWFDRQHANNIELKIIIHKALTLFKISFSWRLKPQVKIEKKLAWALVNIGLFLILEESDPE